MKNSTVTFDSGDKVTVKIRRDSSEQKFSGPYLVDPVAKTLTQNGVQSRILKLTEDELVLKVEEETIYVMYFKKVTGQH